MKYLRNKKLQAGGLILLADLLFFGLINPKNAASPLLFVGFLLLAASSAFFWYAVLWVSRVLVGRPKRLSRRLTIGLTVASVILIALQSIGQLTVRDGIVIAALLGIFWFYGSYYRRKQI